MVLGSIFALILPPLCVLHNILGLGVCERESVCVGGGGGCSHVFIFMSAYVILALTAIHLFHKPDPKLKIYLLDAHEINNVVYSRFIGMAR